MSKPAKSSDAKEASLGGFLDAVARDVLAAQTSFELRRREAIQHLLTELPSVGGVSLAEGMAESLNLVPDEVEVSFWLEEARPGLFLRLWRFLLRKKEPPRRLRLSSGSRNRGAVRVRVRLRPQDGVVSGSIEEGPSREAAIVPFYDAHLVSSNN